MRNLIHVVFAAALLAGCATPAEQAAQMQREADRMMRIYGPACDRLGYQRDSDRWRDCVLQLSAKEEAWRYGYPFYAPPPYRYYW